MLNAILRGIRFVILVLGGYHHVVLENAALRQQLAVFKRDLKRPRLRRRDRLFTFCPSIHRQDADASLYWTENRLCISTSRLSCLGAGLAASSCSCSASQLFQVRIFIEDRF